MVIRFSPTEAGEWDYRVSSNLPRLEGTNGKFNAAAIDTQTWDSSASPTCIISLVPTTTRMCRISGWASPVSISDSWSPAPFAEMLDAHAKQKFNHIRGAVLTDKMFPQPGRVDPVPFRQLDERILAINKKESSADLILATGRGQLTKFFPTWQDRERYIRYIVARYGAMNVTWQGGRRIRRI